MKYRTIHDIQREEDEDLSERTRMTTDPLSSDGFMQSAIAVLGVFCAAGLIVNIIIILVAAITTTRSQPASGRRRRLKMVNAT